MSTGKLFVVGTPIGNLGDLSPRAGETLEKVDFIAAEDTRVSVKLLNHLGIKKPMISYHAHSFKEKGEQIFRRLMAGETCAVITDAGMPCISDPGEDLVRLCHESGIPIEAVPGPSAAVTALAVSGLDTSRFSFEGFLSVKTSSRREHLEEIRNSPYTLIFYEAPHKLVRTLEDLLAYLGDRRLCIARELTKLHEEIRRTTLSQALEEYQIQGRKPMGEFVLIVEGKPRAKGEDLSLEEAVDRVNTLAEEGVSLSDAAKQVSKLCAFSKSQLYRGALDKRD